MATTSDTAVARRTVRVIYAGGTIGMQPGARGLVPGTRFGDRLASTLDSLPPARRARLPDYHLWESPCPIDSSSASARDWSVLARHIVKCYDEHAGFVVLHGTDTLAWCASSLAFQLQGLNKPVIVTGAQHPLETPGSDARDNLEAALAFAAEPALQEVGVCFGGRLLRGCRTRKWYTHAALGFESPNWPPLGAMLDHRAVRYPGRGLTNVGAPRFELTSPRPQEPVVRIPLWPGLRADLVARWLEDDDVLGAVLECWGNGNVPEDPDLLGVLAHAVGEGKTLVAISQCPHGHVASGTYASGAALNDIGVLSGDDMTLEAAFTKLTHLLSQPLSPAQVRHRFLLPLTGERGAFAPPLE